MFIHFPRGFYRHDFFLINNIQQKHEIYTNYCTVVCDVTGFSTPGKHNHGIAEYSSVENIEKLMLKK
jgi:hypothetical protein